MALLTGGVLRCVVAALFFSINIICEAWTC
jgi:hypothetical protein